MASGDYKHNLAELLRAGGYEGGMAAAYSANLAETSKEVQRRVRALKKYQLESINLESEFYARVHELEAEFEPRFNQVYEKRRKVIVGEHEPADNECDLPLVHGLPEEELRKLEDNAPVEGNPSKGVPDFWYNALNNTSQISDMIFEYDVPILKYLTDITTEVHKDPAGFSLYFHFAPNPYFTNTVLKKYYALKLTLDEEDPFEYDGPTVVKCEGTAINWNDDKNVTQKVVKKKQKKGAAAGRFVTKTVSNDSFFNFFDPTLKELNDDVDVESQDLLRADFEAGQLIRDQVIPRAVLFYTGEAAEDDDYYDDEEEGGDEDGSEGENDD